MQDRLDRARCACPRLPPTATGLNGDVRPSDSLDTVHGNSLKKREAMNVECVLRE